MGVSSLLRSRVAVAAALLYLAVSLLCTRLPLLNYLGYEFSVVIALLGSCVSGMITIHLVRQHLLEQGAAGWRPVRMLTVFRASLVLNYELLLIPLALLSANAFLVKNCSILSGLLFYLLLPVVSVWFSAGLGLFCGVHYRLSKTMFFLVMTATFLYALALGYFTPAIFSYNFFYGYFPGFSYDEILTITGPLVTFRVLTVFLGGLLLWLSLLMVRYCEPDETVRKRGNGLLRALLHPRRRVQSVFVAGMLVLVYLFRCDLGFESTAGFIQQTLGGKLQSKHFVLYYSPQSYTPDEIRRVAIEHEFRLAQLMALFPLGEAPPVASYLYPSPEVKRRLVGTGSTNLAKPWSGEIHLAQQSVSSVLKHELAHVLAGGFGLPVIHASLSTGLVEGVAMAVEGSWGNRSLHQSAAAMMKFEMAPDILGLMSFSGFAAHSTAVSYVLAGSLCQYLLDSYGMRLLMQVYRTGDYQSAYGRPLTALVAEWQRFLGRLHVEERDRDFVEVRFRQPTIFRKVCARVVAAQNQRARERFDAKEFGASRRLFKAAYGEGGGYESLAGYVISAYRMGDYPAVTLVLDSLVLIDSRPARFLPLSIYFGDALWALGDPARASGLYEQVQKADIADNLTEAASVRRLALASERLREAYRRYFVSDAVDSVRIAMLDSLCMAVPRERTAAYLRGRVLFRMGRWAEAINALEPLDFADAAPGIEALRLKSLGAALFELGRYEKARAAFWASLKTVKTEVALLEATEWIDRCEWMRRYEP
jgi:tetratricopeptide (TPR) repeat protein